MKRRLWIFVAALFLAMGGTVPAIAQTPATTPAFFKDMSQGEWLVKIGKLGATVYDQADSAVGTARLLVMDKDGILKGYVVEPALFSGGNIVAISANSVERVLNRGKRLYQLRLKMPLTKESVRAAPQFSYKS